MSLENAQVYQNFPAWRVFTVALDNTTRAAVFDLLSEAEQAAITGRPIVRLELHLATSQTVHVSSGSDHAEAAVVGPTAAGPGQRVAVPVMNAHRTVYLRGTGSVTLALYFGG